MRSQRRLRECVGADPRGEPLPWTAEVRARGGGQHVGLCSLADTDLCSRPLHVLRSSLIFMICCSGCSSTARTTDSRLKPRRCTPSCGSTAELARDAALLPKHRLREWTVVVAAAVAVAAAPTASLTS